MGKSSVVAVALGVDRKNDGAAIAGRGVVGLVSVPLGQSDATRLVRYLLDGLLARSNEQPQ
jgi:hypothetical protein